MKIALVMKGGQGSLASAFLVLLFFTKCFVDGAVKLIDPEELEAGMQSGFFKVVVDVRTLIEFQQGHIENATLVAGLAAAGTQSESTNVDDLAGCEDCNIALYCRSGARSAAASRYLDRNGFTGIHDAGGIGAWIRSNRTVVTTPSVDAGCVVSPSQSCPAIVASTPAPASPPTGAPVDPPTNAPPTDNTPTIPPKKVPDEDAKGDDSKSFQENGGRGGLNRQRKLRGS